jgi:PTS system cellobiose-specific IIC component
MPIAEKMSSYKLLTAMGQAMMSTLPFLIVGSFAVLFALVDIKPWQAFVASTGFLQPLFLSINSCTIGLLALYVVFLEAYYYSRQLEIDAVTTGLIALAAFLLLTPFSKDGTLPLQWLGSAGMFSAILVGAFVPLVCKFFAKRKLTIKMPEGVPPVIGASFASLVPGIVILALAACISMAMSKTSMGSVHNVVYTMIQTPLQAVGISFPGFLLIQILATLFFFVGVHANTIIGIATPFLLSANAENLAAFSAGQPIPHIINFSFLNLCQPGGVGGTIGLALAMLLFAKSRRYKSLGRMAIFPAIFNINEPMIFGVPIMLNPLLFVPYLLTPILCTTVSYIAVATGIVARMNGVMVNWSIPLVVSGFLGGGISNALLQVVLVAISILVWFPFFKTIDKIAVDAEHVKQVEPAGYEAAIV